MIPMNLTLYYCPITCSLVSHLALTEAGADFDVRLVNLRRGAHRSPEYLRMNPKHQVPVLVIDAEPLTENVAIQLWIARHFPRARLLPSGDIDEFKAIALMAWCDSGIHPHLTANMLPERYCDLPSSEDGVRRAAQRILREKYQIAEDLLTGREWFLDHFTLPDAFFFWCFRHGMKSQVDMSGFPNCRGHFERVSQRASTQKVLAFEAQSLLELEKAS
jgi:glutathione S-transferase